MGGEGKRKGRKGREGIGENGGEETEGRRGPSIQPSPWASQKLGLALLVLKL